MFEVEKYIQVEGGCFKKCYQHQHGLKHFKFLEKIIVLGIQPAEIIAFNLILLNKILSVI